MTIGSGAAPSRRYRADRDHGIRYEPDPDTRISQAAGWITADPPDETTTRSSSTSCRSGTER